MYIKVISISFFILDYTHLKIIIKLYLEIFKNRK